MPTRARWFRTTKNQCVELLSHTLGSFFAHATNSFTCSALLSLLVSSIALIRLLVCSPTCSWILAKEVIVRDMNASISYSFYPLCRVSMNLHDVDRIFIPNPTLEFPTILLLSAQKIRFSNDRNHAISDRLTESNDRSSILHKECRMSKWKRECTMGQNQVILRHQ